MNVGNERFLLYCDAERSVFALTREGETWREQFDSLVSALAFAEAWATEETPLVVYNEVGKVIVLSKITPLRSHPPEIDGESAPAAS